MLPSTGLKRKATRVALEIPIVFLFVVLTFSRSFANISDCAVNWNLFKAPTGFTAAYTYKGQFVRDCEASGGSCMTDPNQTKGDPTTGPANAPPTATDLASGATTTTNPGPYTTTYFGYYDGGTPYNQNYPSTMNDDVIFFRVRVAADPRGSNATNFVNYHWNILFDVDADGYKEFWIDLDGKDSYKDSSNNYYNPLNILYDNSNNQDISNYTSSTVSSYSAYNAQDTGSPCQFGRSHTRAFAANDGTGDWFIEEQVPMTAFKDSHGNQVLFPDSPVAFVWSTGASYQDPLQKDWMMDLTGGLINWNSSDPIVFGDIVIPDGQPVIRFTDGAMNFKNYYTIGDQVYVYVKDPFANTNDNAIEQIQVTVSDAATGDDEVITLTETGPGTGIFSNAGGTGLPTVESDGILNNSDNSGSLEVSSGDTIHVSYTNIKAFTVTDQASVVGPCQAFIQFTRANGLPANQFILTNSTNTSDQLYVTVSAPWANTNQGTQQSISVNLTGSDSQQLTLTETGNNTGVFRNTTGLQTEIQVHFPTVANDGTWEDNDGGVVTAAYTYTCGGQQYTTSTTAQLFITGSGGKVYFTNGAGTQNMSIYTPGQPIFVQVVDSSTTNSATGCTWPATVTVTSSSGDSETIPLTQTAPGSGVYMNTTDDLVTTAGSAIVTSASSNFNTLGVQIGGLFVIATGPDMGTYTVANVNSATQLTLNKSLTSSGTGIGFTAKPLMTSSSTGSNTTSNGILTAANGDALAVTYHDCNDGDNVSTNDNKTYTATFNTPPVLINEVLFWPDPTTCQTEYIELYNASTQPVDVTGYRVTDGDQFIYTIPQFNGSDILLGAGKKIYISFYDVVPTNKYDSATGTYYLFAPEAAKTGIFPSDELGDPGASNSADQADQISLYDSSNNIIDYVAWSNTNTPSTDFLSDFAPAVSSGIWQDGAYVSTIGMNIGQAIRRITDGFDTNSPADWSFTGTSTICQTIITHAVVSSFDAHAEGGKMTVEWETVSEIGTAGFNLLRFDNATGTYRQVSKRLLPGLIDSPQGGRYRLVDGGASPTGQNTYLLVEIQGNGTRNTYGPFPSGGGQRNTVPQMRKHSNPDAKLYMIEAGDGLTVITDNIRKTGTSYSAGPAALSYGETDDVYSYSREAHKRAARPALPGASKRMPAAALSGTKGSTIKLSVNADGLYYVSASTIATLFGISSADASSLIQANSLSLSNRGLQVGYMPLPGFSGIYFYGQAVDSPYTADNIYLMKKTPGARMSHAGASTSSVADSDASFSDTVHFEQNVFAATAYFVDPAADYWFWDYVVAGDATLGSKSFTLHADGVSASSGDATVTVSLQGATTVNQPGNDHHAEFSLNGTVIGEISWQGLSSDEVTLSFSQGLLKEGDNTITVSGVLDSNVPYSIFYVNSFDLTYQRVYKATGNKLFFRADANPVVTVDGFTSSGIMLFDVTNPLRPRKVQGKIDNVSGGYRISFVPSSASALYLAVTRNAVGQPAKTWADAPSALRSRNNYADYLIITTDPLKSAAQTLATYRQSQGLMSKVVLQENIMDEFNYGIYDPDAVRDFLKYVYHYWKKVPRYILFAGNGTYDYKNNLGYGNNLIPVTMVSTPDGLFSSDNHFADVAGDNVPRMAVGRLPVTTPQEMQDAVTKIRNYEASTGAGWQKQVLLAADRPESDGDFPADSDELASIIPSTYSVQKIYLSEYSLDQARSLLLDGMNSGVVLLNYKGHAGTDRFSQDGLLLTSDVSAMTNAPRLPVVAAMTCIVGQFDMPGTDTLAKALVLNPGGGAVAVWSPTGMSKNSLANILNTAFVGSSFVDGETVLGNAILDAFQSYADAGNEPYMIDIYTLLGDPALRMKGH